ncbi:TonB-dependent receptor [Sphingomonas crusticola]|uniref:TonB-dependent receptor n=1 Tax=Sphingomonas crusticola TaxID=1697973 RepID=UPI0013C33FED|nr:TonB-dependent receptor [Sphingomonas crusticola]
MLSRRALYALGLTLIPAPLLAQADTEILPDIVVTAQRRPEQAQQVGVALSVLGAADLATRGVTNVNQLQYQTPGLEAVPAFGGGQPQFRLRGVGFDDYASNNASPVGISVDEVAKPFPVQTQGLLFDLDRVEVLRGPQGTLYGRNTTGGAINFLTARPTSRLSAGIDAEYGSFGLFRAEGHISGPIGEGMSVRVAAATEQGGGFQHDRDNGRELGDADRWGARGQLAYNAGPVDLLVEGHYGRDRSEATGLYLFDPLGSIPADTSRRRTGWGASSQYAALLGFDPDTKPFRNNKTAGGHATLSIDLGSAKLTSITAYEHFDRREYNDWDASALAYAGTYFGSRANVFSQEVRLASQGPGALRWIVGGYYSNEKLHDHFDSDFVQSLGFIALTSYRQRAHTFAGFGQLDYDVTSRLTLTGGLRLEREARHLRDFDTTTSPIVGIGVPAGSADQSYTELSGKLAANYHLSSANLIYASASRGVKSGGFTAYNTLTEDQLAPFKPEVLYAYEIGTKNELAGRKLRLNGAAFYYDYRRQQVQSAIYDAVYGAVGKIVNAPRSHIYGAEGELTWAPVAGLEITQGLAWRKGKYDRFDDLDIAASTAAGHTVAVSRAGQDQGFPHWSYNGSASYRLPVGGYALTAQTDYSYRGTLDPVLLGPNFKVHDYWLVNATLTLGAGPWSVGLYARNLLNQHYDLTRNFFLGGIDIASPGRPRSVGVRGKYSF